MSKWPKCGIVFSHIVPDEKETHLDHRCQRPEKHYGPCECKCGVRVAALATSFAPDNEGRIPLIKIKGNGQWTPLGRNYGLEVVMLDFGSQDGGWAWIQVREINAEVTS